MDLTLGEQLVDAAVVAPTSACERTLRTRARVDGAAARTEEQVKRRRYGARVHPFVVESGGRPGNAARAFLMRHALADDDGVSNDVSEAWQSISAIVQGETALALLRAWGGSAALHEGSAELFVP